MYFLMKWRKCFFIENILLYPLSCGLSVSFILCLFILCDFLSVYLLFPVYPFILSIPCSDKFLYVLFPDFSIFGFIRLYLLKADIFISCNHSRKTCMWFYETTDRHYWTELAKCNQQEFQKKRYGGKCIEAREFIIALPESFFCPLRAGQTVAALQTALRKSME